MSYKNGKFKILLLENIHPNAVKTFESAGMEVELLNKTLPAEELKKKMVDVNVLGVRSATEVTKEVIDAAPKLLAIGCFCIGTNQVDLSHAASKGIPVFNSPFSNSRSVAELIISLVIGLSRLMGDHNNRMHKGEWMKTAKNSHEVRGQTIGIVGYGHVGSQVSVLSEAMGMKVIFYDVVPKMPLGSSSSCSSLEELLKTADFVTLHVPELPSTKGLIGEKELALMKKGSYLLNYSRGTVVDLEAAAAALNSGHLAGAAFDVYPGEPRVKQAPFKTVLQGCNNTILTPHIGGSTEEAQAAIGNELGSKLVRFLLEGCTLGSVNFPELVLERAPNTTRIVNAHKNTPGVLKHLNGILARFNVVSQSLRTTPLVGYIIIDVEGSGAAELKDEVFALETSYRTRMLE
mmetsp:Transcript_15216/g.26154  ORF Transcript_15216/g.26154 Transcript_15216/m.26154 type:complete len:404 (+) Transcript_15216:43-1254(+)